jgi:hypothetical protein
MLEGGHGWDCMTGSPLHNDSTEQEIDWARKEICQGPFSNHHPSLSAIRRLSLYTSCKGEPSRELQFLLKTKAQTDKKETPGSRRPPFLVTAHSLLALRKQRGMQETLSLVRDARNEKEKEGNVPPPAATAPSSRHHPSPPQSRTAPPR